MTIISTIRANLKRLILDAYPSVEKFALEHHLDKSTLSRILGGKREPKISTLLKIAEALNVGVDAICGHGMPPPEPAPDGTCTLRYGSVTLQATGEDGRRLAELANTGMPRKATIRVLEPMEQEAMTEITRVADMALEPATAT